MADEETFPCRICGEHKRKNDLVPAELIRASIVVVITKEHPAWSPEGYICHADLNRFRTEYVRNVLEKEKNEFVPESLCRHRPPLRSSHNPRSSPTSKPPLLALYPTDLPVLLPL
jgi:hypothetical protein